MKSISPDSPLYGRNDERTRLATLASAEPGPLRGGVVVGGSGLGKTRLLAEVASDAKQNGAVVLWGSCLDVGDSWPLHPLREAAQQIRSEYVNLPASERLAETLEARVLPGSAVDVVAAAHTGLTRLSGSRRLVVIIDDLQWADSSTIHLVRTLLSGLTQGAITLLGGLRTDLRDLSKHTSLLVEFHRSPAVEVVELEPLDESSTREMARFISDRPLSRQRGKRLWRRSGGVPMLVRALASYDETGVDTLRSVHVILAARVDGLGAAAKDLARLVSLGIGPVDHGVARAVLGIGHDEVLAAAREAVAEGILAIDGGGYVPVHDLFREIIQKSLIEPERVLWHRRIAEAIESGLSEDDPDPIQLSHHWAGANDGERALPSFIDAAREASNQGATVEAWQHWQDVTNVLHDFSNRNDLAGLLAEAAESAYKAEEHNASLELIGQAEKAEIDPRGIPKLRFARSRYLAGGGKLKAAEIICSEIFVDFGKEPQLAVEAGAQSADLLTRLGRYEDAVDRATETLERSSEGEGDEVAELLATSALGSSKARLGYLEPASQTLATALDGAVRTGSLHLIEAASTHYAELLMGPLNELEAGVELAERQARLLIEYGGEQHHTTSLLAAATTGLFRLGRWQDARRSATAALESDPTGAVVIDLLLARVMVNLGLGDFDDAERDLYATSSLLGSEPNPRQDLRFSTLRAGLAMWKQDIDAARKEISDVFERVDRQNVDDPWLWAPFLWHGIRAEALAASPSVTQAVSLFRAMASLRNEVEVEVDTGNQANQLEGYFFLCAGELDRVLGVRRPAVWGKAAEVWDRCGHPYPAAYARLGQAEAMFSERTRNSKAEHILRSAHESAESLGAVPLVEQLKGLARLARIDLDQHVDKPGEAQTDDGSTETVLSVLTARESEIIVEVARGLSNREIGERLYISGRTVGVHVSNILSKLGAKTRVEAAAIYIRETQTLEP